jgi:hypothetical protein
LVVRFASFSTLVGQKTGAAAGSKTPSEKTLSTYYFAFQYRLEFKKEGRRTLLRCSGLFSLDRFIRMEDFSV